MEALNEQGNYRNFLDLKAAVVSPKGVKMTVPLTQAGPGHYEARFPVRETGLYLLNLLEEKNGQVQGSQVTGASVNYSPEYRESEPNLNLLRRIAEISGGRLLNPDNPTDENPFQHDRQRAFRSLDLWEWLVRFAIVLFPLDVAVRRVQLDAGEAARFWKRVLGWLTPWRAGIPAVQPVESLTALLARRAQVRLVQPPSMAPSPGPIAREKTGFAAELPKSDAGSKTPNVGGATSTASQLLDAKRRARERKR